MLLETLLPPSDAAVDSALNVSPPRVVLLCADAAVRAHVDAAAASIAASGDAAADAALQRVLRVLGDALRPAAPLRLRAAAASAAVWLRWDAAITALLLRCADADDAASLALAASVHADAAVKATGSASPAVHAALARVVAPLDAGGVAAAAGLRTAAVAHEEPALAAAAAAAAAPHDSPSAAALRAVARLGAALTPPPDDADIAAAREASYVAHLAFSNAGIWTVICGLAWAGNFQHGFNLWRFVLQPSSRPPLEAIGGANRRQVTEVRLHPFAAGVFGSAGGAPFSPRDVPWPVVVSHVRVYVTACVLIRIPLHTALARATRRLRATRGAMAAYERTFFWLMLLDSSFFFIMDLLVAHATSAATEWMVSTSFVHAAGLAIMLSRGPFRPLLSILSLLYRLVTVSACMLLVGRSGLRVLCFNFGFASQIAAVLVTSALAPRRDAAMRAEHTAALEALTRGGGGDAAAGGKAKAE